MHRLSIIGRILVLVVPLVALYPLARMAYDWFDIVRVLTPQTDAGEARAPHPGAARAFDWVLWEEHDGLISATYVWPRSPAAEAGLQKGDVFFMLSHQQFFNIEALKSAIEGVEPGTRRTYAVMRDGAYFEADVLFTRYPTFLYPLSPTLWQFSFWGFLLGTVLHVIGLVIVSPLAARSRDGRFSLVLILVSLLWLLSNFLRILFVHVLGPPLAHGGMYDTVFRALTFTGLTGWIGFPVLLVVKVVSDTRRAVTARRHGLTTYLFVPTIILSAAVLVITLWGHVGPITLAELIAPILFYACCYVGAAAALMLIFDLSPAGKASEEQAGWSRLGSAVMLVVAALFGLMIIGVVPLSDAITGTATGWVVVSAQLLSVAPVALVSHATLKHGKVDLILSRGLTYGLGVALVLLAFEGGMSLVRPYLQKTGASAAIVSGLLMVVLVIAFERMARRLRLFDTSLFARDRRHMYLVLARFQEKMRTILNLDDLAGEAIDAVGRAFFVRSAVIFIRPPGDDTRWITRGYFSEAPYLTERAVDQIWPSLVEDRAIWSRNPELNESMLPAAEDALLRSRRAALVVPLMGDEHPIGLLALGFKKSRRLVYNLEEVDLLRALSAQLSLAIERLYLVEREKALIREHAEAQLVALRAQINPHFLFNALNTIISLIDEQPDEAEATVEHLAAIFRYILQTGSRPFVPLEDELCLVDHYLTIEKARFGSDLSVDVDVDTDLSGQPVPAFAVQTLVENAIKHGLAGKRGPGRLAIGARATPEGFVEVCVCDNGVGVPALFDRGEVAISGQPFLGIGLQNVASRLRELYGRTDLLRMRSQPDEGTVTLLLVPLDGPAALPHAVTRGASDDGLEDAAQRAHPSPT